MRDGRRQLLGAVLVALAVVLLALAAALFLPAPLGRAAPPPPAHQPAPQVSDDVPESCFRLDDGRVWCPAGDPGSTDGTLTPTG